MAGPGGHRFRRVLVGRVTGAAGGWARRLPVLVRAGGVRGGAARTAVARGCGYRIGPREAFLG
ncbi:hypothetical protein GCM10009834_23350 [Streptomonospora arabica]